MISVSTEKIKCDVKDCKNMAAYSLPSKGRVGKFFLCKGCFEQLCKDALALRTPKSPKNTIKKMIDKKAEEEVV